VARERGVAALSLDVDPLRESLILQRHPPAPFTCRTKTCYELRDFPSRRDPPRSSKKARAIMTASPYPSAARGRSIRLFLPDGNPKGVMTAEIPNWTGKAIVAPRTRLPDLLARSEATQTGIYLLLGADPDQPGSTLAYVGEGDNVGNRLRLHAKDDWQDQQIAGANMEGQSG